MNTDEHVGHRIRQARRDAGLTLGELGARLSTPVSPQAVSQWERGENGPAKQRIVEIATVTGVSAEWLLTGELHAQRNLQTAPIFENAVGRIVPLVRFEEAVFEQPWASAEAPRVLSHFPCGPRSFATVISDKSNAPEIQPGDSVIIDPDMPPTPGDMVLVKMPDGTPLLRKFRPAANGGQCWSLSIRTGLSRP